MRNDIRSFLSAIFATNRRRATLIPLTIIGFGAYLKSKADQ
jgi:hypothetical protein